MPEVKETTRLLVMPRALQERLVAPREDVKLHDNARPLVALRKVREARGLTLAQLSLRTGLSTTMLGHLEAYVHAPSPRTCEVLARALEVSPEVLLGAT